MAAMTDPGADLAASFLDRGWVVVDLATRSARVAITTPIARGATVHAKNLIALMASSRMAFRSFKEWSLYGRGGEPCPRCESGKGAGITRIVQAQRATYFCPDCQK